MLKWHMYSRSLRSDWILFVSSLEKLIKFFGHWVLYLCSLNLSNPDFLFCPSSRNFFPNWTYTVTQFTSYCPCLPHILNFFLLVFYKTRSLSGLRNYQVLYTRMWALCQWSDDIHKSHCSLSKHLVLSWVKNVPILPFRACAYYIHSCRRAHFQATTCRSKVGFPTRTIILVQGNQSLRFPSVLSGQWPVPQ